MTGPRQVKIIIAADVASAIRSFQQVSAGLRNVGDSAQTAEKRSSSFGDNLKRGLATVGVVTGIAAVAKGLLEGVKSGMAFEDAMNNLGAVTSASAEQFAAASAKATELGADLTLPSVSARDAAEAMLELSKSGLAIDESMTAARGTLLLSTAAQIDAARAAEIQGNALNTFNLSADHATEVADALAGAANGASGEITDFAAGLQQSGTIAASFGWNIQETTTFLGLMANAGIKGSDAGTSLKTALTQMLSPTKSQAAAMQELGLRLRDSSGNMITAREFSDQLAQAKLRLGNADFTAAAATAFGTDAVRTALVAATNGAAGYDKLAEKVEEVGSAQKLAEAKTSGLSGALDKFVSATETAAIAIYQKLSPGLQDIVNFGTTVVGSIGDMVNWFSELPSPVIAVATALAGVVLFKGPLKALSGAIADAFSNIGPRMAATATEVALAGGKMAVGLNIAKGAMLSLKTAFMSNPIGLAIVGITTLISLVSDAGPEVRDFASAIDEATGKLVAMKAVDAVDPEQLKLMQSLGVSAQDYGNILAGNVPLLDQTRAHLQQIIDAGTTSYNTENGPIVNMTDDAANASKALEQLNSDFAQTGVAQDNFSVSSKGMQLAFSEAAADMQSHHDGFESAGRIISEIGQAADDAQAPVDELSGIWDDGALSADEYSQQIQHIMDKLDELQGRNGDAEAAQRAVNAAVRDYNETARDVPAAQREIEAATQRVTDAQKAQTEAVNEYGAASPEAAAAGRDLADAQDGLKAATEGVQAAQDKQSESSAALRQKMIEAGTEAYNNAVAQGNMAGASDAARDAMQGVRDSFIKAQPEFDATGRKADEVADSVGLIPSQKVIDVIAHTADAMTNLGSVLNMLETMPRSKTVTVTVGTRHVTLSGGSSAANNMGNILGSAGVGWTGGLVGDLMGMASGGLIPGRPPSDPRWDNILATVNGRPMRVRSGEFIVNEDATRRVGVASLNAINAGAPLGASSASLESQIARLASAVTQMRGGQTNNIQVTTADPDVQGALRNALFQLSMAGA